MSETPEPIIITRKSKKSAPVNYNGGMWKVAYADFITAMMAFFLMLWILNSTPEETLQGVAKYFTTAEANSGADIEAGVSVDTDTGVPAEDSKVVSHAKSDPTSSGSRMTKFYGRKNMSTTEDHFSSIVNNIQKNIEMQEYQSNVAFDVTSDGLRIQIMDSDNRPMFKPNTDLLQPYMRKILTVVGRLIRTQPNYLAITGHTNSLKSKDSSEDLWWLSASRANQVRKFLTTDLIKDNQILRIQGKADRDPIDPKDPTDPKNIRISILLLNPDQVSEYQRATPYSMK